MLRYQVVCAPFPSTSTELSWLSASRCAAGELFFILLTPGASPPSTLAPSYGEASFLSTSDAPLPYGVCVVGGLYVCESCIMQHLYLTPVKYVALHYIAIIDTVLIVLLLLLCSCLMYACCLCYIFVLFVFIVCSCGCILWASLKNKMLHLLSWNIKINK